MTSATTTTTATAARWPQVVKVTGLLCGLALPVLGFLGTVLALVAASVLASGGRRREALLVSGVALGLAAIVLVLTVPVASSGLQVSPR